MLSYFAGKGQPAQGVPGSGRLGLPRAADVALTDELAEPVEDGSVVVDLDPAEHVDAGALEEVGSVCRSRP